MWSHNLVPVVNNFVNAIDTAQPETRSPILRLATHRDVPALMQMRREREEWMEARGIHQWAVRNRPAEDYHAQVDAGLWFVIDARPGDPTYTTAGRIRGAVRLSTEVDLDDLGDPGAPGLFAHGLMADLREAGHGVGKLLLDGMVEHARNNGLEVIRIDCVKRVRPFYEKYGYKPTGATNTFTATPPIITYVMDYWLD